jgi:hypothetical protein
VKVTLVDWGFGGQQYKAEVSWYYDHVPYTTYLKVYTRKNGTYYCRFRGRTLDVVIKSEVN